MLSEQLQTRWSQSSHLPFRALVSSAVKLEAAKTLFQYSPPPLYQWLVLLKRISFREPAATFLNNVKNWISVMLNYRLRPTIKAVTERPCAPSSQSDTVERISGKEEGSPDSACTGENELIVESKYRELAAPALWKRLHVQMCLLVSTRMSG